MSGVCHWVSLTNNKAKKKHVVHVFGVFLIVRQRSQSHMTPTDVLKDEVMEKLIHIMLSHA